MCITGPDAGNLVSQTMKPSTAIAFLFAALLVVVPASVPRMHATPQGATGGEASPSPQAATGIPVVLPKGKKLVLTDGTFQLVREYSIEGDRVHYWSVERSAWEEIPKNLVDWDATHQAEAEQAKADDALKAKLHATEVIERTQSIDVDRSLEIKPGVFLPDGVGMYALVDKQIFELKQSEFVTKTDKGRVVERILTGVPFIPIKQNLILTGESAALRVTTAEPEFYIRPADEREPRFRLLRMNVQRGNRIADAISTHASGEVTHKADDLEFQTWTPAHGVFRYTLNERMEPGEYVFVEMTSEGINAYAWDFGVDLPGTNFRK
jgi:hypothetical protein